MGLKPIEGYNLLALGKDTESETCRGGSNRARNQEKYCPKVESPALTTEGTPVSRNNSSYEPFPEIQMESNIDTPVRSRETERLSQKLLDINEESLRYLRSISENMESMASSLKTMTAILQQRFST